MSGRAVTRVCAVSFKECWEEDGRWMSSGGFPLQMAAVASLFDETVLVVTRGDPQAGGHPLPANARVIPLRRPYGADGRRKLSILVRSPYYLWRIARSMSSADAVHVPLPGDIPLLALIIAVLRRKPIVARYGGSWRPTSETTLMDRITKSCMRHLAGGRNVMLATGDGAEPPAPGMSWIFSTALSRQELRDIQPCLDRALGDPPRLAYVGRLSAEKGVANALRTLALLVEAGVNPMPTFTIIGDGPERGALERLVDDLDLGSVVRFAGQLGRRRLSEELGRADICVQPSLTEGFSKAWLDAMAHGVPVLCSDVGAAASVIGGAGARGWLVPPGDPAALAAALRCVLSSDVDWPALRRRCRAFAEERTLELWARRIGEHCGNAWGWTMPDGRLRK